MLLPAFQNLTLCLHVSKPKCVLYELDKMQVNIQGVEHDLRQIEQIYSRLYNNKDILGKTKLDVKMEKVPCNTSI